MKSRRRVYPNNETIHLAGGKNSKFEVSIIGDNESPDCLNVVFEDGAVGTRQGFTQLNTAAVGSFVIDGLYTRRADNGTSETMIAFAGGSAWQLGTTSFTVIPSGTSIFTAGIRVTTAQYENKMFVGNGGIIPYKWDGSNWTRHGVYPPTATPTVTSQAVGVVNGDVQYKVSAVNSGLVESDVGPASTTFAAANGTMRVTLETFPVSHGVSSRRLYRSEAGAAYKRVATISDNTSTTYDDNVASASLGVTAPTDNGVPPKYNVIIYHQSRLFMNDPANPSYVWYSNLNTPYTVASTNFQQVGDGATDIVTGLGVYDNSLYIYCEKSVYLWYMPSTDPTEWQLVKTKSPYGTKSPHCIIDYDNKQMFVAMQKDKVVGVAAVQAGSVAPDATSLVTSTAVSDLKSNRISPDFDSIVAAYVKNISGIVYKNKVWIAVTYGAGSTTNNRVFQYDFGSALFRGEGEAVDNDGAWVPFTGINAAQFTVYGGNLYFGSATANGFVYQLESGAYSDNGSAINSYYWTKEFGGFKNEIVFTKDFRFVNILADTAGDYFMNVYYRTDSDPGDGTVQAVDLNPGSSLWGTMVWGVDTWGGGSAQKEMSLSLDSARGRRIQFKFSNQNTVNQRFKVHHMSFSYNLKGNRRGISG